MTLEEIKALNGEAITTRMAEIKNALNAEDADIEKLTAEVDALEARKAELIQAEETRKAQAESIAQGKTNTITKEERKEEHTMNNMEIRKSAEYINAFANYIKSEDDKECRALLTENVSGGTVPVPTFVEDLVRTAWDREGLMAKVKKSYLAGNIKVGFERSATGAVIHTEGTDAPTEETLLLGIVSLVPQTIKKWITISDEVMDMAGEDFLRYIYDEITYQIAKKAADTLVAAIVAAPTTATATAVAVAEIQADTITQSLIVSALGQLGDNASNPVVVMNKGTYAAFKGVQYAGKFATDIFEGLEVVYNNSLPVFGSASATQTYAIVGDFGRGALANFPNGEGVKLKFDDLSLAESDLVKIVGREPVALGIVGPGCFCRIAKAPLE